MTPHLKSTYLYGDYGFTEKINLLKLRKKSSLHVVIIINFKIAEVSRLQCSEYFYFILNLLRSTCVLAVGNSLIDPIGFTVIPIFPREITWPPTTIEL